MKTTFLAIIFSLGIFLSANPSAPYMGKWENVSSGSPIKEVVFFADNNVKLSNETYALLQRYSLSPVRGSKERFVGYFESVTLGKVVKRSTVELNLLEVDLIEIQIDGKKLILKKD